MPLSGDTRVVPLSFGTSWRERPLEASLLSAEAARKFAGVSRIARIDGLAGLGFPVYSVARPLSKVAVTIHSGKGTTESEARASGLFEAIEVACAETSPPSRKARESELASSRIDHISLERLCSRDTGFPISWSEAIDYQTRGTVLVPECALSMLPMDGPYEGDTTGLASGSSIGEALFHGLTEVIERHNYSLALVNRSGLSLEIDRVQDAFVCALSSSLKKDDLRLEVKDISQWTGIPTYYSLIFSDSEADSHLVSGGLGTHLDPLIALRRALTEAIQSRAVAISGIREDISDAPRARGERFAQVRKIYSFWYESTAAKAPVPESIRPIPFKDAVECVLNTARRRDPELGRLVYYAYPSPEDISVVRAILEGAEVFGLDRKRLGPRIRKIYQDLDGGKPR